jgi:hypothetical protein
MDGGKMEQVTDKVFYYCSIYFSTLLPVPTEVIPSVSNFSYLFCNQKGICEYYAIPLQYSNRVYHWLNLTFLFVGHFTALALISIASDCRITGEFERM